MAMTTAIAHAYGSSEGADIPALLGMRRKIEPIWNLLWRVGKHAGARRATLDIREHDFYKIPVHRYSCRCGTGFSAHTTSPSSHDTKGSRW